MRSARRLLPYLLAYRRPLALGLASVVATTAISLISPWVLQHAIDDLMAGVTRGKLAWYAAQLLALGVLGGVFRFLMRRHIIGVSRHIEYDLRNDFFARLQRQPAAYFQARRTGDLMSRATSDLNAVRTVVGPAIMYTTNTAILFVVAIVLMASIDWRLTLMALVPLPAVSVAVRYFGQAIHHRFERIQAQLSELSAVVQETLAGVRVVRAYRQERAEIERFARSNREYLERNRVLIRLQSLFFPSLSLLLGLGALLVLWLGGRAAVAGRITIGEFVAFNAYLAMLAWPMIAFGWVTNMTQRGMASWQRLLEVLDAEPAITDPPAGRLVTLPEVRGEVEFRALTFAFGDQAVLHDVSVRVEAGRTLALVGATGAGKSALISLLPRLYDPPPGTVFLDGVDVRDLSLAQLRSAIGFVSQEPFLFSDTLANNIAFSTAFPAAEQVDRVRRAAGIAQLDKDVAGFPKGYETMVGERGITLSGGRSSAPRWRAPWWPTRRS